MSHRYSFAHKPNRLCALLTAGLGLMLPLSVSRAEDALERKLNRVLAQAVGAQEVPAQAATAEGAVVETTASETAGQPEETGAEALAKKLSNPLAAMISVPFQFNYDRGMGFENDGRRVLLNVQPVIPISLTENWNLISRTIVPVVWQGDMFPSALNENNQFGLGDITQSFFLSPVKPSKYGGVIWGAGPVFLFPSAGDKFLGAEKWGAGPTAVVLKQSGPWSVGVLGNHIWSFAGDGGRPDVNVTYVQPFVSYTTPKAWTFGVSAESTYNWDSKDWAVPINFSVSKLIRVGKLPVQLTAGVRYWADHPEAGPEGFGARTGFTLLLPKR